MQKRSKVPPLFTTPLNAEHRRNASSEIFQPFMKLSQAPGRHCQPVRHMLPPHLQRISDVCQAVDRRLSLNLIRSQPGAEFFDKLIQRFFFLCREKEYMLFRDFLWGILIRSNILFENDMGITSTQPE